jgi:hypothetical protein
MELGNCHVDTNTNAFVNCEKGFSKFGLIGYEVDYLYNLFNSAAITGSLTLPDKSVVSPDKIQNIQKNLKNLIDAVENSLWVKNSIVSDVVVYNNVGIEDKNSIGCLEDPKTKRFSQFKNSLFSDEYKVDKLHPVFKLTPKDFVNYYDLALLNKKKYSTFACMYKKFNFEAEDVFSTHLWNREFINGVKLSSNSTAKADGVKVEDCTNLWVGKGKDKVDPNKMEVEYLCLNKTTNFLDNNIITDLKVKIFPGNKCAPFKYNDRDYNCICDKDLAGMAKKNAKIKRFLCYSRKTLK